MDANEKDAAKLRRREEMLARRLGEALDRLDSPGERECPDAEVIAAYSERALAPGESAQWEGHFATCARCRTVLRVLAASGEARLTDAEITRLGEIVSVARPSAEPKKEVPPPVRRKTPDWRIRWFAPAFGVAAVLAVWFAFRPPWRGSQRQSPGTLVAQAPKVERQRLPIIPAAPGELAEKKLETNPAREADKKSALPASGASALRGSVLSDSKNLNEQKNKQLTANDEETAPIISPKEIAPPSPAAMPPPQAMAQSKSVGAPSEPVPPSATQTVTVAGAAPLVETTNGVTGAAGGAPKRDDQSAKTQAQMNATLADAMAQESAKALPSNERNFQALSRANGPAGAALLLKAPSGSILWRVGKNGAIEQSVDARRTWVAQPSPSPEDWLAGAAVSDAVCWLAGRNGAIARTQDGEHWVRVSPPAQAKSKDGKFPDWAAIAAQDADSATVTASDGRRFATRDAGKTWESQ